MNQTIESIRTLPAIPFITRSTSANSPLMEPLLNTRPATLHPAGSPYGHMNNDCRHRDVNGHVVLDQYHCAMCYKYACPNCGSRTNRMFMRKCYNCDYQVLPVEKTPEKTCEMKLQDPCTTCSQPQKWLKSKQILIMLAQARQYTNPHMSIREVWQQIIREQCVNRDIQILKHEYNDLYFMFMRNIQIARYLAAQEYQKDKK